MRLMRVFQVVIDVTRAKEWWQHKLPVLLGIAYLVGYSSGQPFASLVPLLAKVILVLVPVASYVCVINDLTDEKADRLAGKSNRLSHRSRRFRVLAVAFCLMAGAAACWLIFDNLPALLLYLANWLAFSLYSFPPVRLKERGGLGILADACGGQLLPSLWTAVLVSGSETPFSGSHLALPLVVWALATGLRGILFHQVADLEADRQTGVQTFAVRNGTVTVSLLVRLILFPLEVISLVLLLILAGFQPAWPILAIYILSQWLLIAWLKFVIVLVVPCDRCRPALFKYYQIFLPLTFALALAGRDPRAMCLIPLQLMLFPDAWKRIPDHCQKIRLEFQTYRLKR